MRPIKELLEILDREIDGEYFKTGLCLLMVSLWRHDIININEWNKLEAYIYVNNPDAISMDEWDNQRLSQSLFWWNPGEREPRHEYVRILIDRIDNEI